MTNGQSSHPQFANSNIESETTAIMFNLDSLNKSRPETMQN